MLYVLRILGPIVASDVHVLWPNTISVGALMGPSGFTSSEQCPSSHPSVFFCFTFFAAKLFRSPWCVAQESIEEQVWRPRVALKEYVQPTALHRSVRSPAISREYKRSYETKVLFLFAALKPSYNPRNCVRRRPTWREKET